MAYSELVPITREFLAKFYKEHAIGPVSEDVVRLIKILEDYCAKLDEERAKFPPLSADLDLKVPEKIDENLWRNREQCEEILKLLTSDCYKDVSSDISELLQSVSASITTAMKKIEEFQKKNSERIFQVIMKYLPNDFRLTLIKLQKERSEKKRVAEVDNLIKNGGSIKEKYNLLWRQQMDRRKTLAQLGSASGVFKVMVKVLAGVPQVLLDFIKRINDKDGPMIEQRLAYGPRLYELTKLVNEVHKTAALCTQLFDEKSQLDVVSILKEASEVYETEIIYFLEFIHAVFEKSPFLISAEEAAKVSGCENDQFTDITVGRMSTHEVCLEVEDEGFEVGWDFRVDGASIAFSVLFKQKDSAEAMPMLPKKTVDNHQGDFLSTGPGTYILKWENADVLALSGKKIKYRAFAIPPLKQNDE